MAAAKEKGLLVWAIGVPAMAAAALFVGWLSRSSDVPGARPGVATREGNGVPAAVTPSDERGRPASIWATLDRQPEVILQHVVIELAPPFDSPEAMALLARLGGPDPAIRGVFPVEVGLDVAAVQRAIRGVSTATVQSVMGVIVNGGQSAGIGVETETTDPTTGLVVGRRSVSVLATVTALEGHRVRVEATLDSEDDSNAVEVLGRQAGLDLGDSAQANGSIVLEAGQAAAIRLPGPVLRIVFLMPRVNATPPTPTDSAVPAPDAGSGG